MCKKNYYRYSFICTHYYDVCWEDQPWGPDCEGECDMVTMTITNYFTLREPCQRCKESNRWALVTNEGGGLEWMPRERARRLGSLSELDMELESLMASVRELEALEEMEEAEEEEWEREEEELELGEEEELGESAWEEWRDDDEPVLEEDRGDPPPPYSP